MQYDDGFTDAPVTVEFKDDPVVRGVSEEDVDDNEERPYQHLRVRGELQQSRLWFDPLAIVLTPVPLQTAISIDFQILASSYIR